ncbi:pyruvate kinase-like protein [Microdochium bolleyi]|uniref:Pyruvate kinase-like protein n=1 Tax=Microdochium bolleyi TaxID=196109 RepID=A0A136J3U1_9PEZI|nr:pyruvate kinase-like protein [Microdochium bolleyi]
MRSSTNASSTTTAAGTFTGTVIALSLSSEHNFSKPNVSSITLLAGLGVAGDCHAGETVQHRSRLHIRPAPTNLRQVHLIPLVTLQERGLKPGEMGENIVTSGLDLLGMPTGTKLLFVGGSADDEGDASNGDNGGKEGPLAAEQRNHIKHPMTHDAMPPVKDDETVPPPPPTIVLTGVRNPCPQIEKFRKGLQETFIVRDADRKIVHRLAGVMAVVEVGGVVKPGMRIEAVVPSTTIAEGENSYNGPLQPV